MKRIAVCALAAFLAGGIAVGSKGSTAKKADGANAASAPCAGNVSKARREALKAKLAAIKTYLERNAGTDENAARLLSFAGELEKELRGKKFGLVFEEHREKVDAVLSENLPVFTEVPERFLAQTRNAAAAGTGRGRPPGGPESDAPLDFLIEGDNLAALKLLEKTHRGKIDLIYIDPPYNTGNKDFVYNDSYVDKTDAFRHSKWLSFMQKRLEIARRLMSDKGVIFISIDDNEQAALKLLCDEIFGEGNFVNQFIWRRNSSGKTEKDKFTVNTEYLLLYRKSSHCILGNAYKPLSEASLKLYKHDDGDGRGKYQTVSLQKPASPGPETTYDYVDNNGTVWKCPPKGWRMTYEKIKALENDGRLSLSGNTLRVKDYWNERANEGKRIDTLWIDLPENTAATKEVSTLFDGEAVFTNPKPTELIKRCLQVGFADYTILDFFAGSGTTGHAVMKLNAEDGGKRRFILVTNNENGICEKVTHERLKRVIEREGYDARVKYFRVDYVPIGEDGYWEMADSLLGHVRELVELENGIDFAHDAGVAIALTDEDLAAVTGEISAAKNAKGVRVLYRGHNTILDAKAKRALERRGVEVRTIPDYYYPELED